MAAPNPRMHGLVHSHGGPDPVMLAWDDTGVILGYATPPDSFPYGVGADTVRAYAVTVAGGDLTVTSMHCYCTGVGFFRLAVWAADGAAGRPGTLVCQTVSTLTGPGAFPLQATVGGPPTTPTTLLNGVTYWLGFHDNSAASGASIGLGGNSGATATMWYRTAPFGTTAPNPFSAGATSQTGPQPSMWVEGTT